MLGDLLVVRERTKFGEIQLNRVLDQPVDTQPVAREVVGLQFLELVIRWALSVMPEVR